MKSVSRSACVLTRSPPQRMLERARDRQRRVDERTGAAPAPAPAAARSPLRTGAVTNSESSLPRQTGECRAGGESPVTSSLNHHWLCSVGNGESYGQLEGPVAQSRVCGQYFELQPSIKGCIFVRMGSLRAPPFS